MAERRMFAKNFVESDGFANLSNDARLLYFYIGIHADDDGFNGQVQRLARSEGIGTDCIGELVDKGYLLQFDSGVYLLRHWNVNNHIQKDRYHPTNFSVEKSTVFLNQNKIWELKDTDGIQDVSNSDTETGKPSVVQKGKPSEAQRRQEESGETRAMTHRQLVNELLDEGVALSDANRLISKHGEENVESNLASWRQSGKPGTFERYLLTR